MRNFLIVANGTSGGEELNESHTQPHGRRPRRFHVIVPAPGPGGDDTLDTAKGTLALELAHLASIGAEADGEIGDHDPIDAIGCALEHEKADEIILSTLPAGISRLVHLDLPHRVEHRFHIPVSLLDSRPPTAMDPEPDPTAVSSLPSSDANDRGGSGEPHEPAADLDRLEQEIEAVRLDVAQFHHEGEWHFWDQESTRFGAALDASERKLNHLDDRWCAGAVQSAQTAPGRRSGDPEDRLEALSRRIRAVRRDLAAATHESERHFCD